MVPLTKLIATSRILSAKIFQRDRHILSKPKNFFLKKKKNTKKVCTFRVNWNSSKRFHLSLGPRVNNHRNRFHQLGPFLLETPERTARLNSHRTRVTSEKISFYNYEERGVCNWAVCIPICEISRRISLYATDTSCSFDEEVNFAE